MHVFTHTHTHTQDFQPMRFLDRFVYKNPKKSDKPSALPEYMDEEEEAQQKKKPSKLQRKSASQSTDAPPPVNTSEWLRKVSVTPADVAPEDLFFYRFRYIPIHTDIY